MRSRDAASPALLDLLTRVALAQIMRRSRLSFLTLLLLIGALALAAHAQPAADGSAAAYADGEVPDAEEPVGEEEDDEEDGESFRVKATRFLKSLPKSLPALKARAKTISNLASRISLKAVRNVDAEKLTRARRLANIGNGLLLAASGPVFGLASTFALKLSNSVLSLYITAFGAMVAGLELGWPIMTSWMEENLKYFTTMEGRTAMLAFAGSLAWCAHPPPHRRRPLTHPRSHASHPSRARRRGFGSAGSFAALLTCANALFNANFDRIVRWVEDGGPMPFGGADDGEDEGDLMEQVAAAAAAAADAPAAGGGAEAAADAGSEAAEAEAAQKRAAAAELRRRRLEQLAEQARAQAAQAEAAQAAQQADVDVGEPE